MTLTLSGLHHVTAITAHARENKKFYTETMGMRLVKRTVNQDDTSAYHLFYADGKAAPGSDMTFFDWPVDSERRGTNSISRTGLRVNGLETLTYWQNRFADLGVKADKITETFGRSTLDFEDFEGQRFRLTDDKGEGEGNVWEKSTVPAEHQIRGLGPVTISVRELAPTEALLVTVMNMRKTRSYPSPDGAGEVFVFEMGEGGAHAELHVAVQPTLPTGRQGAGAVHHVAFRTPTISGIGEWANHVRSFRVPSSGEVERYYFKSLYFREPGGNLFEIASDQPGFAVDEPMETLGERLSLPPFLEHQRAEIEANLKPID